MTLSTIERVRRKTGDRPSLRRESNKADGIAQHYKLKMEPVQTSPPPDVWKNDILQTEGADYTVNYEQGIIDFTAVPATNASLVFQYYSVVYTDVDIQDFLDQYSDNPNITAAHILLAWAADIAKLAKRETLQGGGGLGAVTRDTSVAAKELRATAKALLDYEIEYGTTLGTQVPAEGLTEVAWTEQVHQDIIDQKFIRNN